MATALSNVIHHLRRAALLRDGGPTDGELLEAVVARRDEPAFEALVRRHGPMVLGVCRRVLGNVHDADDAFQATFIVLARKSASVRPRELVGNWLHGVAYRTALAARTADARRRARERQVHNMPEPEAESRELWPDLQPLLDRELTLLPDKYRVPIVLCELEGRARKDVARQLGIPEGTLSSRLAAARKRLAARLSRRGVTLSGAALASLLSQQAATACVPPALVFSTVQGATAVAAGGAAVGLVSAKAAALAKGVMASMFLTKLKIATVVFLTLGLLGAGVGTLSQRGLVPGATAAPQGGDQKKDKEKGDQKKGDKEKADQKKDKEKAGDKKKAEELVTLTGAVSKQETKGVREDGTVIVNTRYFLTETKGNKIQLPGQRFTDNGIPLDNFNLAMFVGKEVLLKGRALTAPANEGPNAPKRVTKILAITEIKALGDAKLADPKKEGDKVKEAKKDGKKDGEKAKDAKKDGEPVTLTGTISKQETKTKKEDGTEAIVARYFLTETKGNKVQLPAPRIGNNGIPADGFNLAFFVGREVVLTGRAVIAPVSEAAGAPTRVVRVLAITDLKEKK